MLHRRFEVFSCIQIPRPFPVSLMRLSACDHFIVRVFFGSVFIAQSGIIDCGIEELIQELPQLLGAEYFDRAIDRRLSLEELPEILLGENNSPDQLAERDSLSGATDPDCRVAMLDVFLFSLQKPVAQLMVDFI